MIFSKIMHIICSAVQKACDWFVPDFHKIFFSYLQWSMRISFQKIWFIQHGVRWLMSYSGINKNIDYNLNRKPKATVVKMRSLCHCFHRQIEVVARSHYWRYWRSPCWILQRAIRYEGHRVICRSSLHWPTSLLLEKNPHFVHSNVALGFGRRQTIICCSSLCSS